MNEFEQAVAVAMAQEDFDPSLSLQALVCQQYHRIKELEAEICRLSEPWPGDFFLLAEEMPDQKKSKAIDLGAATVLGGRVG